MQRMYSKKVYILIFLLPALILFCGVLIAPIGASAYYSLFNWNGLGAKVFIGLKNYKELFTSNAIGFMKALRNSLLLAGLSVFLQLPLALGLALTLGKRVKGERLRIWLGTKKTALGAVFVPTLWQYVGYHMLLLYAGVKSVPPELREAAMLDGATDGQVNRYIVLPYIKPIIRISVIFAVTGSLKSFDLIYVLTNGGPLHSTEVPSTLMINMLFLRNRYGMGSAIAVLLIVLCFGFALLISAIFREEK